MPSNSNAGSPDAGSPNQVQVLLTERMILVNKLTDLNARHIKAETQRSGIEIEISSLETKPGSGNATNTIPSGLKKLKEKYEEQLALQQSIDTERERVIKKLDTISAQLDSIY